MARQALRNLRVEQGLWLENARANFGMSFILRRDQFQTEEGRGGPEGKSNYAKVTKFRRRREVIRTLLVLPRDAHAQHVAPFCAWSS